MRVRFIFVQLPAQGKLTLNTRQAISDLSFSHDGEYLAIAGAGNYIDIVRAGFFFPC